METSEVLEQKAGGHSRKKIDLTGQQYGRLTVLRPGGHIGKRTAWVCRCKCGNEVTVKSDRLRDGRVTSCGCLSEKGYRPGGSQYALEQLTLVDGTCVEMLRNKKPRCSNTSGVVGVDWQKKKHRWRASICFKGRRLYLGSYAKFDDAVKARRLAEEKYHDAFLEQFDRAQQAVCSGEGQGK